MRQLIVERVLDTARYIIDTGATVRAAAAHLGVSKTTRTQGYARAADPD